MTIVLEDSPSSNSTEYDSLSNWAPADISASKIKLLKSVSVSSRGNDTVLRTSSIVPSKTVLQSAPALTSLIDFNSALSVEYTFLGYYFLQDIKIKNKQGSNEIT